MSKLRKTAIVLSVFALAAVSARPVLAVGLKQLFNTGCVMTRANSHGCFMTNVKGPVVTGSLARGSKSGRACGYNVLALFSWGDVRITTAIENAGISEVSSVDYTAFELIPGFYGFSRYCTVVNGE